MTDNKWIGKRTPRPDGADGHLSYDADGNGGGAAVTFAILAAGLSPTSNDFLIA